LVNVKFSVEPILINLASFTVVKAQRLSNENVRAGEAYVFPDEQDDLTSFTGGDAQIMVPNSILQHVVEQLSSSELVFWVHIINALMCQASVFVLYVCTCSI